MIVETNSSEETKKIAADFAKTLVGGELIFLEGELGSGKTTFVQGLLAALGYEGPVKSPTFTIMNQYKINHPIFKEVVHADMYRLKNSDLDQLGLEEWQNRKDVLILVEWPKFADEKADVQIKFSVGDSQDKRFIEILKN